MSTKNRLNFDQTYTNYKIVKTFFYLNKMVKKELNN